MCALLVAFAVAACGKKREAPPAHADAAVDLLDAQSAEPYAPELRLAALGQLAGCAPDRTPPDLVPTALALLRERSERRARRAVVCTRPYSDTLVGRLRRLRPSDEEGSHLLRTLHQALDDRVSDRIALLVGQLSSPDWADRCNAVWMSGPLLRAWRANFSEPVALINWLVSQGVSLERIGLEAGLLSQWLYGALREAGLAVELLETRHVKAALSAMPVKTDRKDTRSLAQLMRLGWARQ